MVIFSAGILGQSVIAGRRPSIAPRGAMKDIVRLGEFALPSQRHAQIIERFAILRLGVEAGDLLTRHTEPLFGVGEQAPLAKEDPQHGIHPAVAGSRLSASA